ncbi:MAG: lactonase family protein [Planctomycetes bacterium]|nr:lactonase family protein [Planctomycetota bacterium]
MKLAVLSLGLIGSAAPLMAGDLVYVSVGGERRIAIFEQQADGSLKPAGSAELSGAPGALAVDPERRFLFASLRSNGRLASFAIGPAGELKLLGEIDAKDNAAYVATDRTGRWLLSAYYGTGRVAVHAIDENGRLRPEPVASVETAKNAHAIVTDSANRFAFVPHTGPNAVWQFRFDVATGTLAANDPPKVSGPDGASPRHIVFHPRLPAAYTSNELGSSVTLWSFDGEAGTLSPIQTLSTLPEGFDGSNTCADVQLTPDGRYVYVSNRGHDSLAGFAIDERDGRLKSLGQTPTERTPRSFAIDAAGAHVYGAGQASGKLAAYHIGKDGGLERFATYDVGSGPTWVQVVGRRDGAKGRVP